MKRLTIVIALGLTSSGAAWPQRSPDLATAKDLERLKAEYGDVLALQGTSRDEVFAIARLLRAKPEMAIDQIRNSREYCLKSGQGTMTHYASDPTQTREAIAPTHPLAGLPPGIALWCPYAVGAPCTARTGGRHRTSRIRSAHSPFPRLDCQPRSGRGLAGYRDGKGRRQDRRGSLQ